MVAPEHWERTAFTAGPLGFYEYIRMPFGLTYAPPSFQRLMERVLDGLNYKKCLIYLDDIITEAGGSNITGCEITRRRWLSHITLFVETQ